MQDLIQLGESAALLIEAEARSLRKLCARIVMLLALGIVLLMLALIGVGFAVAGVFLLLDRQFSPAASALMMAGGAVGVAVIGGILVRWLFVRRIARDHDVKAAHGQLRQSLDELDLLAPLRRRPLGLLVAAVAAGALLSLSSQTLLAASELIRSLTRLLAPAFSLFHRYFSDRSDSPVQKESDSPVAPV